MWGLEKGKRSLNVESRYGIALFCLLLQVTSPHYEERFIKALRYMGFKK